MRNVFPSVAVCALLAAGSTAPSLAADPAPANAGQAQPATPFVGRAEVQKRIENKDPDLVVLDVRTPDEYAAGHVPGARNVPHDQLAARLGELSSMRDKQVVLYCRSGRRSALAEEVLRQAGFKRLLHLEGDFLGWEGESRPVERTQ
jgi:rhodanese-related sulfurtransferase